MLLLEETTTQHRLKYPNPYFLYSLIILSFLDNVSLSRDFSISVRFRTYQRSGLLFALDASEGKGLVLQQKLGQVFVFKNDFIVYIQTYTCVASLQTSREQFNLGSHCLAKFPKRLEQPCSYHSTCYKVSNESDRNRIE